MDSVLDPTDSDLDPPGLPLTSTATSNSSSAYEGTAILPGSAPGRRIKGSESDNADRRKPLDSMAPSTWPQQKNLVGRIDIGESMNPDDPATWLQEDSKELADIGESVNPDDPSTWPQEDPTKFADIGESINPDDPSTWPQEDSKELADIGESINPDDANTWPRPESSKRINVGEPTDPDDSSTWPQ